jgi:hypothetical protein
MLRLSTEEIDLLIEAVDLELRVNRYCEVEEGRDLEVWMKLRDKLSEMGERFCQEEQ